MISKLVRNVLLGALFCLITAWGHQGQDVSGLRSGSLKILPVLTITDDSLPAEAIFEAPVSICQNGNGDIFVCDAMAANIKRFDSTGKLIAIIGRRGQGPGEFSGPSIVHASERYIAVWDRSIRYLVLLTLDGRFLKNVRFDQEDRGFPMQIRSLPDGRFILETERLSHKDEKDPQECLISLYSDKMEFIKTLYSKPVFRFKRIFLPGYAEVHQPFNPRVCWDVTPEGRVAIGYSDKYEIEIHDPDNGKQKVFAGSYRPIPVTAEDKEGFFSHMTVSFIKDGQRMTKKGAPDYIADNTFFPEFKPAFDGLRIDTKGNIWVHVYREDREREKRSFDAFSSTGNFIGPIEIQPPGEYPNTGTAIKNEYFWKIEIDVNGSYRMVRFKIGGN